MMSIEVKLNLARKWRSQHFDQIIGQDLVVRMLKNSIYIGQYFPVYLFAGQRGCGKTSMARVFAAAVNCEQLLSFQSSPQNIRVPCLQCTSCQAMLGGIHPDFIEIDAASHTGVDNVRQIIDASTLLPLMGRKKIYLIDEAHMLSKAAFNALLKILEEPPHSVLFILATTDAQKILDTIRSRCFQLFFKPVEHQVLQSYLATVCTKEDITYDQEGLALVVRETSGSVRDALNLIEQVRFASGVVTKTAVLQVLGYVDDEHVIMLLEYVLCKKPTLLLQYMAQQQLHHYSAAFIWYRFIDLVRAVLWIKYGVSLQHALEHVQVLERIAQQCSLERIGTILEQCYIHEELFLKTTVQHIFLETFLLRLCRHGSNDDTNGAPAAAQRNLVPPNEELVTTSEEDEEDDSDTDNDEEEDFAQQWKQFVHAVDALNEPLLASVFKQGEIKTYDKTAACIDVTFARDFTFFKDWLDETQSLWLPLLRDIFDQQELVFNPLFVREQKTKVVEKLPSAALTKSESSSVVLSDSLQSMPIQKTSQQTSVYKTAKNNYKQSTYQHTSRQPAPVYIDVSDTKLWQKAHLILHYFPGRVSEVHEAHEEHVR